MLYLCTVGGRTIYLKIDHNAGIPVSAQIAEQITYQVVSGTLAPGAKIPSVRGLASDLSLNPTTVARVYQQLESDGIIYTQRGRGTFIAPHRTAYTSAEQQRRLAPLIRNLVVEAGKLGLDFDTLNRLINEEITAITDDTSAHQNDAPGAADTNQGDEA